MKPYFKNQYTAIKILDTDDNKKIPIKISEKAYLPYFSYNTEKATVNLFMNAMFTKKDYAKNYLAKGSSNINMQEVESVFDSATEYKYLIDLYYKDKYKKFKKNSVLIINENEPNTIIHFFLKHEPDGFSEWKIYFIENE